MSTNTVENSALIETDNRGRVTLPGSKSNRRYLVREEPDGTLILEPAVVITELERRYLASAAAGRVDAARRLPRAGRGRPPRRTPPGV